MSTVYIFKNLLIKVTNYRLHAYLFHVGEEHKQELVRRRASCSNYCHGYVASVVVET